MPHLRVSGSLSEDRPRPLIRLYKWLDPFTDTLCLVFRDLTCISLSLDDLEKWMETLFDENYPVGKVQVRISKEDRRYYSHIDWLPIMRALCNARFSIDLVIVDKKPVFSTFPLATDSAAQPLTSHQRCLQTKWEISFLHAKALRALLEYKNPKWLHMLQEVPSKLTSARYAIPTWTLKLEGNPEFLGIILQECWMVHRRVPGSMAMVNWRPIVIED